MNLKYKAKKTFAFDAAHFLPDYPGKCANMHGHTYKLEVVISRSDGGIISGGSSDSMVLDFSEFNKIVKETVLDRVDHRVLNDVFDFQATSENMAGYFFGVLKEVCEKHDLTIETVSLWESNTSCIEVSEADL
jgi:6-pyruvoyltetrahydropterin/6-carboxytetrahydropterin synthase